MPRVDPLAAVKSYLVAVDGTDASYNALAVACDLARRTKARVSVLYVIEVPRSLPLDADLQKELDHGESILSQAERVAREHDIGVRGTLLQAREAGHALVEESAAIGADAIVLGLDYDYHKPFGRFEIGALSEYVLQNAPCEVWLIRYPPPVGATVKRK